MANEIIWKPPEWPPEESGTYSADVKLEGVLKDILDRQVLQSPGGDALDYTALHVQLTKATRVADVLNESETRTALGPHSSTGYEGLFELWLPKGSEMPSKVGEDVVCMTKGACQVLRSIQTVVKKPVHDPLAHLVKKLENETAKSDGNGVNDDEWDD